jgi:hypothetical protein
MITSLRFRILTALVGAGLLVGSGACTVDTTEPTQLPLATTPEQVSSFQPTAATRALIGVTDGVYSVTVDPKVNNVLPLGANRLELPANSICNIATSGYGSAYWNRSCTPQTAPLVLTVTVKGAATATPLIDFQPAMRFNPLTKVSLYFYVPSVSEADRKAWTILYCGSWSSTQPSLTGCVNEAKFDTSLTTYIDYRASVLYRRIKHFSAYRVDDGGYVVSH